MNNGNTIGYEVCVISFIPFSWVKRKTLSSGIISGNGISWIIIKRMIAFLVSVKEFLLLIIMRILISWFGAFVGD